MKRNAGKFSCGLLTLRGGVGDQRPEGAKKDGREEELPCGLLFLRRNGRCKETKARERDTHTHKATFGSAVRRSRYPYRWRCVCAVRLLGWATGQNCALTPWLILNLACVCVYACGGNLVDELCGRACVCKFSHNGRDDITKSSFGLFFLLETPWRRL
ncbi:hypothetical protein B0J12DRAFT_266136 [Macrophomina phaseolina]|uniref:Uncharacterized protein n=1 Tax=Macrophomina phaseolina TaxID=35725 RepID=A0ABQ8G1B4_9PEZI|nr:hypothetical protein B0J12DRAFT_266136 [Macrophomina phaseolina]